MPEALCCELRERLCSMLELGQDALLPGPGGSFLGLLKDLLSEEPLGITTHIPPGGVFPVVSPQCVGREKDRLRYVNAKVWDSQNYSSYHEHKEQADKVLQTEINEGYVQ